MAIPFPAPAAYLNTSLDGITLECIAKRNAIAKQVAIDVGGVEIAELHAYVTDFCDRGPRAPATAARRGALPWTARAGLMSSITNGG